MIDPRISNTQLLSIVVSNEEGVLLGLSCDTIGDPMAYMTFHTAVNFHKGGVVSDVATDVKPFKLSMSPDDFSAHRKKHISWQKKHTGGYGITTNLYHSLEHFNIGPYYWQGDGYLNCSLKDDLIRSKTIASIKIISSAVMKVIDLHFPDEIKAVKVVRDSIVDAYVAQHNVIIFPPDELYPMIYIRDHDENLPPPCPHLGHKDYDVVRSVNFFAVPLGDYGVKDFWLTLKDGFQIKVQVHPSQPFIFDSTQTHIAKWSVVPRQAVTAIWYITGRLMKYINEERFKAWPHDTVIWKIAGPKNKLKKKNIK